jgi:hypothetical protein
MLLMKRLIIVVILCYISETGLLSAQTAFPIKANESGRYLVDRNDKPFFYQADTPWFLFIKLEAADMEKFMDIRISQGFNVLQVMALPMSDEKQKDVNGEKPFQNNDFSQPNENYWNNIRNGVLLARKKRLLVGLAPAWKGCCGGDWNQIVLQNGAAKCREYGRFLGKFFAGCDNLFWIQGGDCDPGAHSDHYREIALGIKESMPLVLQTYHASSGHSSSDVMNYIDHTWMNFSWTYTYFPQKHNVWIYIMGLNELPHVYFMNHLEYRKRPIKPFVLGESQYEGEDSPSFAPLKAADVVRRQAYWSVLSGSCGHAYGSWNWKVQQDWQKVASDKGANEMKYVRSFFESIRWTTLIPDIDLKVIQQGAGNYGKDNFAVAAYSENKSLLVIYIPPTGTEKRKVTLSPEFSIKASRCRWFNPVTGIYTSARKYPDAKGSLSFTSPGDNGSGFNDWILIIEK